MEIKLSGENFLASEVGIVTKTYTFDASNSNIVEETLPNGCVVKTLKAGTIYPSNDVSAEGIVFTDVTFTAEDITNGFKSGALMVAGRYLEDKILVAGTITTINSTAKTTLASQGLFGEASTKAKVPNDTDGTLE